MKMLIGIALLAFSAVASATSYSQEDRASMWARSGNLTTGDNAATFAQVEVDWIEAGAFDDPNGPKVAGISSCIARQYPRLASQMAQGKWKPDATKGAPAITLERYVFMTCSYPFFKNEIRVNPAYHPAVENVVVPYNEFIGGLR